MQIPSIRVLSPALELLGEFDAYTSLQFSRLWQGVGDFEFHLFGELDERVLAQGNLVLLDADGTRAGIIRSVEQDDGEGGVTVTVRGQTLNGLAGQRTTLPLEGEANGGYDVVPALESAGQTPFRRRRSSRRTRAGTWPTRWTPSGRSPCWFLRPTRGAVWRPFG